MGMVDLKPEMMNVNDAGDMIVNAIDSPNNCVVEEMIIRRVAGDF